MSPGIPPSPDRQERQRVFVVGTLLLLGFFFFVMYLTVFRPPTAFVSGDPGPSQSGSERLEAYIAEEERASAYQALRDYMDQKKSDPGIAAVYCRGVDHTWTRDGIEFRGDVDFQRPDGELEHFGYTAELRGSKAAGWEILSADVTPLRQ